MHRARFTGALDIVARAQLRTMKKPAACRGSLLCFLRTWEPALGRIAPSFRSTPGYQDGILFISGTLAAQKWLGAFSKKCLILLKR